MSGTSTNLLTPRRKKLLAIGAGAAITAAALASAAGLGGLTLSKLGAENGIVADAFSDGVKVEWGDPVYQDGTYVIDQVTVARKGVDSLREGNFASLRDSTDTGMWFVDPKFNMTIGTTTLTDAGLELAAPQTQTGRSKAGTLFYTGVRPLAEVDIDQVKVDYTEPQGPYTNVLAQIPVYVGPTPGSLDVVTADNAAGSPIFSAADGDRNGFALQPVSDYTQNSTSISFNANTVFRMLPEYSPSMGLDVGGTDGNQWRGTLADLLRVFPNAVTPGLWVNMASNDSSHPDTGVTVTAARFAGKSWSFTPAPLLPKGQLQITVADASGTALSNGTASSDGTENARTFTINPAIPVSAIGRVSVAMHNVS